MRSDVLDARQREGETREGLFDRLLTQLQETGACRVATLSIAEIQGLMAQAGIEDGDGYIDVAGFLYVRAADGSA